MTRRSFAGGRPRPLGFHGTRSAAVEAALDNLGKQIEEAGYDVDWSERTTFVGFEKFHCRDPFGNRLELMTPSSE